MFNFRRKTREEIAAETFDAGFDTRSPKVKSAQGLSKLFKRRPPPQYARTEISHGVNFYSANAGARNLVVGFGGSRGRLNMAIYMILRCLDVRRHDLLLLSDENKAHFENGIEGYAGSLLELTSKVRDFAAKRRYSSLITYGTSMGGFPALRGGALLGANRAISIGGRFPYHPARLAGSSPAVKAFDVLCECRRPFRTPFYLLYATEQMEDDRNAAILSAIESSCRIIRVPGNDHNFPHRMRENGKLDLFFSEVLDLKREPSQERLAALLEPASDS